MLELNPTAFAAQPGVGVNVKILSIWEVECVCLGLLMRCFLKNLSLQTHQLRIKQSIPEMQCRSRSANCHNFCLQRNSPTDSSFENKSQCCCDKM